MSTSQRAAASNLIATSLTRLFFAVGVFVVFVVFVAFVFLLWPFFALLWIDFFTGFTSLVLSCDSCLPFQTLRAKSKDPSKLCNFPNAWHEMRLQPFSAFPKVQAGTFGNTILDPVAFFTRLSLWNFYLAKCMKTPQRMTSSCVSLRSKECHLNSDWRIAAKPANDKTRWPQIF